jgi:hypothetical protein
MGQMGKGMRPTNYQKHPRQRMFTPLEIRLLLGLVVLLLTAVFLSFLRLR